MVGVLLNVDIRTCSQGRGSQRTCCAELLRLEISAPLNNANSMNRPRARQQHRSLHNHLVSLELTIIPPGWGQLLKVARTWQIAGLLEGDNLPLTTGTLCTVYSTMQGLLILVMTLLAYAGLSEY